MKMSKEADYGNWVPTAMMKILWCATTVLMPFAEELPTDCIFILRQFRNVR